MCVIALFGDALCFVRDSVFVASVGLWFDWLFVAECVCATWL